MLTLERVAAGYGRITALHGVSLTVGAAEFVCLIGANGAGKSTTLKTISGLVRAGAGRIVFDGQEIQRLAPQDILRRGIAHCPEAGTLSGGEQQMLAIGRCLMARPRLILFDEPSLGLAPTVTETVFQIIAGIQREGTTVLMVEQNAYMALQLAGRAYVMETGRITLEGPAKDLMQNDHVKKAYLGG